MGFHQVVFINYWRKHHPRNYIHDGPQCLDEVSMFHILNTFRTIIISASAACQKAHFAFYGTITTTPFSTTHQQSTTMLDFLSRFPLFPLTFIAKQCYSLYDYFCPLGPVDATANHCPDTHPPLHLYERKPNSAESDDSIVFFHGTKTVAIAIAITITIPMPE